MNILKDLSVYAVPVIVIIILLGGIVKNIKLFDTFVDGAKDGIRTIIKIIPSLVGLLVAIGVFKASGTLDILVNLVSPITKALHIPSEILPLVFLRPVSGSASLALVSDMLKTYGPDSYVGRVASTMLGSTETIFYTLAVYFGSVGIKNIRYTLVVALLAELVSVIVATIICRVLV